MPTDDIDDGRLNLKLLHFLQENTGAQHRQRIGAAMADIVNGFFPRAQSRAPDQSPTIAALSEDGFAALGPVLTQEQAGEVTRYLEAKPCFNAHIAWLGDNVPRRIGEGAETFHYGSYQMADILAAPYLIELANRPDILGIAEGYLGCTPTLYGVNAWWSFSGLGRANHSQSFHRDLDDYRFCTLFCFLTDVGPQNGAHVFLRRSHRADLVEQLVAERGAAASRQFGRPIGVNDVFWPPNGYGKDELYKTIFSGLEQTVIGPAGFGFMADTVGLHMGVPLTEGRRLMFWARYGIYKNPIADQQPPLSRALIGDRIGHDPRSAYINRCIVR